MALRRVLTRRLLVPSRADEARIDACTDLATLERWLDQAVVAQLAQAEGPPALVSRKEYPVWSPDHAFAAAETLLQTLRAE